MVFPPIPFPAGTIPGFRFGPPPREKKEGPPTVIPPAERWQEWLQDIFPTTFTAPLATYHAEFWDWLWGIGPTGPGPDGNNVFAAVWARGWSKSSHMETSAIALATHGQRRYGWYVCSQQPQADDHIGTISEKIVNSRVSEFYPALTTARVQMVGDKSRQRGWRRNRIWTADGFAIDALGLDSAVRGAKLDNQRPDFIYFDDIDEELDAEGTIDRKEIAISRRIIFAAAPSCIFIVGQNLVHPNGIVTKLVDGRAKYLGQRTVSGPHPGIEGLEYEGAGTEAVITAGRPTWDFMSIEVCQQKIRDGGIESFLAEVQHEVTLIGESRFDREAISTHEIDVREPIPAKELIAKELTWALDPYLSVWSLPIARVPYVLYFDGAEGVGLDYCVTVVVRADTKQMVAMIRDNKREQAEHAKAAAELWRQYNRGLVGWERSHEADFAAVMAAEGVDRIYEHPEEQTLTQRMNGTQPAKRRGYPARQRERRILVARIARYIERHEGQIPSAVVLSEARTFIKTPKQPDGEASPGNHDDALFGFGGALLMSDVPGAQSIGETEPHKPLRAVYHEANILARGGGYRR